MKMWRKSLWTLTAAVAVVGITSSLFLQNALAAAGQVYLTPASSSVQKDDNVTVSLRINPGTTVDGVQATVYYDAAKLQYVTYSAAGSGFSVQLQQTQAAGSVTVARGDFSGGVSTDVLIETLTFKALVGTGSANVTVSNQNATSGGAYTNPGAGNATVNFTTAAAPATCPAGQTGTPPNCTTPSTGGGTTTPPPSTGGTTTPKPSTGTTTPKPTTGSSSSGSTSTSGGTSSAPAVPATVSKENVQFTKATISVTSAKPTQVYIKYGLEQNKLLLSTAQTDFGTSHNLTLDPAQLIPGQTYYYTVVSKDQAGNVSESKVANIKLKGIPLKVGVFDAKHNPIAGKQVTLHSTPQTATTDENGFATFTDVSPGNHNVIYTSGGKENKQQILVTNNITVAGDTETAALQSFSVVYDFTQTSVPWARYGLYIVMLVAIAAAVFLFITRQRRLSRLPDASQNAQVISSNSAVVGGDRSPSETILPQGKADHMDQLKGIPGPSLPNPGSTIAPQGDERKNF